MTAFPIQSSMARGELSPRLHARVDIEHYRSGLATCFNATIMRQGGWRRRPGSYFAALAKLNTGNVIVREFVFSSAQSYVLELGHLYARFFANQGQVISGPSAYEIATPWAEADLPTLQFTQRNDVVYVTHKSYAPRKLQRFSETNWTISEVVFEDGPYLDIIADGTTLTPSGTGNIVPIMSGATAPSGAASASSEVAGFEAWHAFDGEPNTEWQAVTPAGSLVYAPPGTTVYLQYQFPLAKIVSGYYLGSSNRVVETTVGSSTVRVPGSLRAPRSWKVRGSNNGTDWTLLDSRVAVTGWGDGERRYFDFQNSTAYAYYRLEIIDVNKSETAPQAPAISEWALAGGGADRSSVTLTASTDDPINNGVGFTANDVGRHVRFLDEDASWHWFKITGYTSATAVTAQLYSAPLPSLNPALSWRLGAFGTQPGWPACSELFQGRMFYARTDFSPQSVWGSRVEDFEDFGTSIPLKEDDAISLTIAESGEILWLRDMGELVVGSTSGLRPINSADKTKGFSATNYQQGRKLRAGSASIVPAPTGESNIMVGKFGESLRELVYGDGGTLVAPDVSILSEHIYRPGVADMAFAPEPAAMLWNVLDDGTLAAMTYEREQKMVAHHRHAFGGAGEAISICSIPGETRDEVWFVVDRPGGLRTIEYLAEDWDGNDSTIADAHYVDCGLAYDGAPTSIISGLDHLEGLEVSILADGAPEPVQTVTGGEISLQVEASKVHVGLGYASNGKTLPIPTGKGDGSGLGRKKVLDHVILNVLDVMVLEVRGAGGWEYATLRNTNDNMDSPVPLFTGDVTVKADDRWDNGGVVEWRVTAPVPAIVRAVTPAYDSEP